MGEENDRCRERGGREMLEAAAAGLAAGAAPEP